MTELFSSVVLRCIQALLDSSPTLLAGILIALSIKHVFGRERVAGWISSGRWTDLPKSWLFASVLPLCSIGVLPVLYELHAAKVRPAVLALVALRGAIWNPFSFAYGLDRLGPSMFFTLVAVASIVVISLALLWEILHHRHSKIFGSQGFTIRSISTDLAVALLGIAVVVTFVPHGHVGEMLLERSTISFLSMIAIATPAYVPPAMTMMQIDQVLHQSTIPGLMIVILLIGGGITLGTWSCLWRMYGLRAATSFVMLFVVISGLAGAGLDRFIYRGFVPREDTHAFDSFGQPFHPTKDGSVLKGLASRLNKEGSIGAAQMVGISGLMLLALLRVAGVRMPLPSAKTATQLKLPRWVAISCLSVGTLIAAYVLALNYFTHPSHLLAEFKVAQTEWMLARQSGDAEMATITHANMERVISRLPMSLRLRQGTLRTTQRDAVDKLRQLLDDQSSPAPGQSDWISYNGSLRRIAGSLSGDDSR